MNNFRQFFTVAVTAFVVTFPFAFVACGDDSLSANDVPVSQAGAGLESSSSVGDDDATISSPENDETLSSSSVADASGVEQEGTKQPSHTITHTAECTIDNEGLYETVIDTVTVYPDGKVWDRDVYYHCESGEWVETECRDPLEACAGMLFVAAILGIPRRQKQHGPLSARIINGKNFLTRKRDSLNLKGRW